MKQQRTRPPSFIALIMALGLTLSTAQTAFAMVAFDGLVSLSSALAAAAFTVFGFDHRQVPSLARAVVALVAGRGSGKSWLGALRLLHLGLTADLSRLGAGEAAFGPIVGPDLRLARQDLRYIVGEVERGVVLRLFGASVVSVNLDALTLCRADGRHIAFECLPASRGGAALRGRTFFGALIDEAAFLRGEDFVANAEDLFAAISPRILPGGQVLVFSSPWTRSGLLFDLWKANRPEPVTALVGHAPTLVFRGDDAHVRATVEREYKRNPRNARRELGAEFVDAEGVLCERADVEACVDGGVTVRPPEAHNRYFMTIDVGLRRDGTLIAVWHVELRRRPGGPPQKVLVLDAIRYMRPKAGETIALDDVEAAILLLVARYRIRLVAGDSHYADALAPRAKARGVRFQEMGMGLGLQTRRVELVLGRVAARSIRLLDDPTLVRELVEVRERRRPGGLVVAEAPNRKGAHDEGFDVTALACEIAESFPTSDGSDIRRTTSVNVGSEGGLEVETVYAARAPGGGWVPSMPPNGTPAFHRQCQTLLAQGVVNEEIEAYAASLGLRVGHGFDPSWLDSPAEAPAKFQLEDNFRSGVSVAVRND